MNTLNHLAIIMDGNGRWAKQKNKPRSYGHKVGVQTLKTAIKMRVNSVLRLYLFTPFQQKTGTDQKMK